MRFFKLLFSSKKYNSPDVLGVYPEYMQVKALPERRYMKTARVLAIFIILNLACVIGLSGYFVYNADRVDVTIGNRNKAYLYTIDSSRKVLLPAEYAKVNMSAYKLYVEQILREYIKNRHEIIWDNTIMQWRWDRTGPVGNLSHGDNVYGPFQEEARLNFEASRSKGFVRDVHLYELTNVYGSTWEGVLDTFDMPIPDPFNPLCACSDNSKACIDCKVKNAFDRKRYRVIIRLDRRGIPNSANPLGYLVQSYHLLHLPIDEKETYWGVPTALKPDL